MPEGYWEDEEQNFPFRYYSRELISIEFREEKVEVKARPNFQDAIDKNINYPDLIGMYQEYRDIVSYNKRFYTPDGAIADDVIKRDFYNILDEAGWTKDMSKPVNNLTEGLRISAYRENFKIDPNIIPLKDGDLEYIGGCEFVYHVGSKRHVPYRLPMTIDRGLLNFGNSTNAIAGSFRPDYMPSTFGKWMRETFMPEDFKTIQQMFGYCLIPSTKVQEMFMIVGEGGVGKGGIKAILKGMLGNAFTPIDLNLLLNDKFRLAQIENKLVALEDELQTESLNKTDLFKKLVTNEGQMAMERKWQEEYEGNAFAKIICLTNTDLTTIGENNNEGFFRRIHPIRTKVLDPNRVPDPAFYEKLTRWDLKWIFLWSLFGLMELIDWDRYKVHWSERSKEYIQSMKRSAVNMEDFIEDCCVLGEGNATTVELYEAYRNWARMNGVKSKSQDEFSKWLRANSEKLKITSGSLSRGTSRIRGYRNIKLV